MLKPAQCKLFGKECTPERPVGALMVSSEGSCAAYYSYEHRKASTLTGLAAGTLAGVVASRKKTDRGVRRGRVRPPQLWAFKKDDDHAA